MISIPRRKKDDPFEIGEIVIERSVMGRKKRIGQITFIRDASRKERKLELIQLRSRNLQPLQNSDMRNKFFCLEESKCKRLNLSRYARAPKFKLGQIISTKLQCGARRYGKIIGFLQPDGLYSTSYENGHNGKDWLECVEISPRNGLPRKILFNGKAKVFSIPPERAETCEVIMMDDQGGIRIGAKKLSGQSAPLPIHFRNQDPN